MLTNALNASTTMKSYLSVTEIADITEKERSTVFRWIKSGKFGRVRKLGNEYQIPHDSFEQWWLKHVKVINGDERTM